MASKAKAAVVECDIITRLESKICLEGLSENTNKSIKAQQPAAARWRVLENPAKNRWSCGIPLFQVGVFSV